MLITHILLGFVYKAVPQMNIFFVAQPVYIFLGLLTMMISLPVFAYVMGGISAASRMSLTGRSFDEGLSHGRE